MSNGYESWENPSENASQPQQLPGLMPLQQRSQAQRTTLPVQRTAHQAAPAHRNASLQQRR